VRRHFEQCDLGTEAVIEVCEFEADGTAANDGQFFRQGLLHQRVAVAPHSRGEFQLRQWPGAGTGRDAGLFEPDLLFFCA